MSKRTLFHNKKLSEIFRRTALSRRPSLTTKSCHEASSDPFLLMFLILLVFIPQKYQKKKKKAPRCAILFWLQTRNFKSQMEATKTLNLRCIAMHFEDGTAVTSTARSSANAKIVEIIFLNGFAGPCMEWSKLTLTHSTSRCAILRGEHKTARVYGDLAKYRAGDAVLRVSGTRREHHHFFWYLRPSIQTKRRCFSKKFLPEDRTRPTVNLLWKWYRTELLNKTETHDALLRLLRKIHGHSESTGRNRCVLRDPKQDANLSHVFVAEVLRAAVPCPIVAILNEVQVKKRKGRLRAEDAGTRCTVDEATDLLDAEELELEWWEHGACFGIAKPLDALADCDVARTSPTESPAIGPEHTRNRTRR